MSRGPKSGRPTGVDYVGKARRAYGEELPDWIEELARFASQTSGTVAAGKIGYSPAVVSHVIAGRYKGDLGAVEGKVRGALMGVTVMCPILGEIGRDHCLDEQRKENTGASALRAKIYRACRNGCPHSRLVRSEVGR